MPTATWNLDEAGVGGHKGGCDNNPSTDRTSQSKGAPCPLRKYRELTHCALCNSKFKIALWKPSRATWIQSTNAGRALRAASSPNYFWQPWLFSGAGQTACPLIWHKIKLPPRLTIPTMKTRKSQQQPEQSGLNNAWASEWRPHYKSKLKKNTGQKTGPFQKTGPSCALVRLLGRESSIMKC